ncbi:polyphosphate kinase 2 family protein [Marinilongibacter aquaticus]|uniref:PPK2 family polyphosphate kinase n=1 Tax=Marinilongibacter aquaticus TaxID=2975157 RepID=UPI0021BD6438|nr:PPK2 family polyphosphate kinase [Marinilongibacter aquaticus]UBM57492.1 polyphosphate kinase 2 family protein [Marinilongibacter aquaticus]
MSKFNTLPLAFFGKGKFEIAQAHTQIEPLYKDKKDYKKELKNLQKKIDEHQNKMYAHDQYGMLIVFQALDAAGKDSTIKNVFKDVHPLGTAFHSFKRPSDKELDHDYMWRCFKELPERGKIMVFNRSYYEELLVVKVHPEIVDNAQKIPKALKEKADFWENRYSDIRNFEKYLNNNGIVVMKFFLNVSKKEQGRRLIDRIQIQEKNWKFEEGDIRERGFWSEYQQAYEELINKTSSEESPWHVIPADDKKSMRLLVAAAIEKKLASLDMDYPETSDERQAELKKFIGTIQEQDAED